jgi:hypothetical protein
MLMHLQDAASLRCIGNSSLEFMRSQFTASNDSLKLRKLANRVMYPSVKINVCHVTLHIDYNQINGNITIEFGEATNHTGSYLGIEVWYPLVKEKDSVVAYIDYVCSSKNFCDQIFVNEWIHWLANIKHEPLQDKLIYLLPTSIQLEKCDVAGELAECSNGICAVQGNKMLSNITVSTGCVANASTLTSILYVKFLSIEFQPSECEELLYYCVSDGCNRKPTIIQVWRQIADLFILIEYIFEGLRDRNELDEILNQLFKKPPNTEEDLSNMYTTTHVDYSSTIMIWSGCTIVFLVVAYICRCTFCSRESEGYRETSTNA